MKVAPSPRVFAALGPGDVVKAHADWLGGIRTPTETSITYSSQTFRFLHANKLPFWVTSSNGNAQRVETRDGIVENRPKSTGGSLSGLRYHLNELKYAFSLWRSASRFKATHALVDSGTTHWFALAIFSLSGIDVIPNLHNVYWPVGHPPSSPIKRLIYRLDRWFFTRYVKSALGVSPECGRQVLKLSAGRTRFFDYRIQFAAADFESLPAASPVRPLRILFVGRVEQNKGVFDLLRMFERIEAVRPRQVVFDVCGTGSAQAALHAQVHARGLADHVHLHGKLARQDLLERYAQSYLVVVPTRSNFCEGLPGVCVEAVLAGRPVVTSSLSNALDVLHGSLLVARQDDADDYAEKILQLIDDYDLYQAMCRNGALVSQPFCDESFGLTRALQQSVFGSKTAKSTPSSPTDFGGLFSKGLL